MGHLAVGRADLLRCLHTEGPTALPAMAGFAGFRRRPRKRSERRPEEGATRRALPRTGLKESYDLPEPTTEAVQGVPFYRVVGHRPIERELAPGQQPDWYLTARPFTEDELQQERIAPPESEPLIPWPRFWPFLRSVLGLSGERREPDLDRLVEMVSRGRMPRRLPCRRVHRWAPSCQLILDLSPRLLPFQQDYWRLLPALARLRGHLGLEVLVTRDGPEGEVGHPGDPSFTSYVSPEAGTPVLILSDLGCMGEPGERAAWRRFGRRLRREGLTPVALMPCPPRFWDPRLAGLFFPVAWDRSYRLPKGVGGPRPWPGERTDPASDPGASRLLDLLAPAVRLEPALLRALRHALPSGGLDVGAEAAAWVHPHVIPSPHALSWADQKVVEQHRIAYCRQREQDRGLAGELIRRYHTHLTQSVRDEEAANLAQLDQGRSDPQVAERLARTLRTLEQADGSLRDGIAAWAARMGGRQHEGAWGLDPRRAAIWVMAHRQQLLSGACNLPPGLDISAAGWVLDTAGKTTLSILSQQGTDLVLAPLRMSNSNALDQGPGSSENSIDPRPPGSPLARLRLSGVPVQYEPVDSEASGKCSVPAQPGTHIPLPQEGLRLRADDAEIVIRPMQRPAWAHALGRDEGGLFADIPDTVGRRRLRWSPPGEEFHLSWGDRATENFGLIRIPHGAFWDQQDYGNSNERMARPSWAARTGIDEHGLWAEFQYEGVTQRLRWIWPGEFAMGSPEDEPERFDKERRHQVLLTRGFWLADTACTQALWQAVMGENPSQFEGAEQPVEQVSWERAQEFIARMNETIPGLKARLPAEAEWEYACRAGTQTPFSFGESITTEQVNYYGDYPYSGGEKGEIRSRTVEVKALPANAWGLYQMHGNVWEWCQDWYDAYPEETTIDPVGPTTGERRVVRGGSWFGNAWYCRSARRNHGEPGDRSLNLGFRLARGPMGRPAEPEEAEGPGRAGQTERSGVGQALRRALRRVRGK